MNDKAVYLAGELLKLGVSQVGVSQLLTQHSVEEIERQLEFLPYRKVKRPGGFIVDAIRNNYSPPKEFFSDAKSNPPSSPNREPLDKDSEPTA